MNSSPTYIDLFAGAGGLSEGFIKAGFNPIAHVEMSKEACDTLKTRLAFHYLNQNKNLNPYFSYLQNEISREELWKIIPFEIIDSMMKFQARRLKIYSNRLTRNLIQKKLI
jgi:DNA (cytosine-5)-methyltransferase 1